MFRVALFLMAAVATAQFFGSRSRPGTFRGTSGAFRNTISEWKGPFAQSPFHSPLAMGTAGCEFVSHAALTEALKSVVEENNGGFGFDMWATVMNRNGHVCQITHSGDTHTDQWPGSRVISAQKANTANAFCLPEFALSTANLYQPTQPGGSLYGLQHSNPVDTDVAYGGDSNMYGSTMDPMVGKKVGGVNVFGGGLGLYNKEGTLVGSIGVSGDSSCADHVIAWKVRHALKLDYVPDGPNSGTDNIILGATSAFGHPGCLDGEPSIHIANDFPNTHSVSAVEQ